MYAAMAILEHSQLWPKDKCCVLCEEWRTPAAYITVSWVMRITVNGNGLVDERQRF